MFGYIKPQPSELKVKENELYKSIYCGLCRAMGIHTCRSSRFTLSYDFVFLALVRIALEDETITVRRRRCALHPIKKRPMAEVESSLRYSAMASAVLNYYKLTDDITDTKGAKKLFYLSLAPAFRRYRRRASLNELDLTVKNHLTELTNFEQSGKGTLDSNAEIFGQLLGAVFSHNIEDRAKSRIAFEIGLHTGRWIYIIDACDDFAKDKKRGEYNPLSEYDVLPAEELMTSLTMELTALDRASALIEGENSVTNIINNIIHVGMPEAAERILKEKNR